MNVKLSLLLSTPSSVSLEDMLLKGRFDAVFDSYSALVVFVAGTGSFGFPILDQSSHLPWASKVSSWNQDKRSLSPRQHAGHQGWVL